MKNYKHFAIAGVGEDFERIYPTVRNMPDLYREHQQLKVGDKLCILDTTLVLDNEYARIPVECIFVELDPRYPDKVWYYFRAVDDENLNTLQDNKFEGLYYKILESTSPYIIVK